MKINAQKNLSRYDELVFFVHSSLDSFQKHRANKSYEIKGVILVSNLDGELSCYSLYFEENNFRISNKEYKWLFQLLHQLNYKTYAPLFYSKYELEISDKLVFKVPYKKLN
ncbi:MAG: hypothetical protein RL207_1021 [Bacteroidota bacterium]|jgi:hypothetical protein